MQAFCHIIAERQLECWRAWFRTEPEVYCGGIDAEDAMSRLLAMYGDADLNLKGVVVINSKGDDGHVEYLVPHTDRRRYPVRSSAN